MEFGIFDHVERRGADAAAVYRDRLALLRAADEAGYFCYHAAEHHGTPLSLAPSPALLLAAAATVTSRIRLGPLCYVLPLYDPLRLIEEVCMLDQLSGGRLELGIGRGVSSVEMNFFGIEMEESRSRFEETLAILLRGLSEEELSHEGEHFSYDRVPMALAPLQRPHPPIWYPTSNLESVPFVAAQGYHTIFQGSLERVAAQVESYHAHAAGELAGRKIGLLRFVVVAADDRTAYERADRALAAHLAHLDYLSHWQGAKRTISRVRNVTLPEDAAQAVASGWGAIGSPETVIEQIAAMREATGCNYLVYNPLLGETPLAEGLEAVERFAGEVLPALA
ncbi:MAG TPA: LLM class flavin-dependent oxidoreductase [Acidimicrobiales bacterium]|nr:LLM class flavin-dependent oxidoreductase [Acidimicrobiales bacterium]